jgi:putative restriction endonuclease
VNYWWVNHSQTHEQEIHGGYIWSPKTNRGGGRNQTYLNLTEAQLHDVIFSYAHGTIKAIGVITQKCLEYPRPPEFGAIGQQWSETGWLVKIDWQLLERPIRPKDFIGTIAPLLPTQYSPIRITGDGNQSCYLARISNELGHIMLDIARLNNQDISDYVSEFQSNITDHIIEEEIRNDQIPETEKEQLIKARVGQGLFRQRLEHIENRCRLTGITDKRLLIAGHIKPWRDSNNREKLDGENGFLLSPHVDRLFDRGWISFANQGKILCSNNEIKQVMIWWNLNPDMNVGNFTKLQKQYLQYHRDMHRF